MNTGYRNTGYRNTGDRNTGDWNTGDWNTGDWNTGVFCTEKQPKIKLFDVESEMTFSEWRNSEAYKLLSKMELTEWIQEKNMTEDEKTKYPEAHVLGGYLKKYEYKEACAKMWKSFTQKEKKVIKDIPNFDKKKFEEITGIKA
jgi:hypothetical protein